MRALRGLRALARVELRELRRHTKRSLLIVFLVALPVAAVVGGATIARITEQTAGERAAHAMGEAALVLDVPATYDDERRLLDLLGPTVRIAEVFAGAEKVRVPGRELRAEVFALDAAALAPGGLAAGMLRLTHGRAPANSGEVALSPVLLAGLGRSVGETVALSFGPARTITGVVVDPEDLEAAVIARTAAHVEYRGKRSLLVGGFPDADADALAKRVRDAGFVLRTRSEMAAGDGGAASMIFVLGSIGFLEAALVIAAAFGVSLRRRRYEIGLLGSTGASSSGIVGALVVSAACIALLGGALGAAAGVSAAALAHPHLDGWNHRMNGAFEVAPMHVAGALLLGVVTAILAAALPAYAAARVPIRDSLGGRRPARARSERWLAAGVAFGAAGVSLLFFAPRAHAITGMLGMIGGPVLSLLGFGLASPWLLDGLARGAAPLPLVLRLAVRDAGRFRARNGSVVTAIVAGMSMSVTAAVLVASIESAFDAVPATYRRDQLLVAGPGAEIAARRLAAELPAIAAAPLAAAHAHGQPVRARFGAEKAGLFRGEWVACGGVDLLRALGVDTDTDASASAAAFRAGDLLAFDAPPGAAAVELTTWLDARPIETPPVTAIPLQQKVGAPLFFIDESALARFGMEPGPPLTSSVTPWLLRLDAPVTPAILERARAAAAEAAGTSIDAAILHLQPARLFYSIALAVCIATGLIVVLVATALSAAESAADESVLDSIGAAPSLVRGQLAARAGYLALLGTALAVPVGFLTATALVEAANFPLPLVIPWRDLGVVLLALPALAFAAAWFFGGAARAPSARPFARLARLAWFLAASLPLGAGESAAQANADSLPNAERALHADDARDAHAHAHARASDIAWEPYAGRAFDGSPLAGELGRIRVPERRGSRTGRTIELAFVRYRTSNPNPEPPIVFLAGGPGGSGVELCGPHATHPQIRLLEHSDVIGLDQRGTGLSVPRLSDEPQFIEELPRDRAIDRADVLAAFDAAATRCVAYWKRRGVDLSAYNSNESADDIDDLRAALGVEQIVTYGASYGSHLSLAYLRRHPARAARAVMMKVEGPDDTWKLPSTVQRCLSRLGERVANDASASDSVPDFLSRVDELLRRFEESPPEVTVRTDSTGATDARDSARVTIGRYDLQCAIARALAESKTIASLPASIARWSRGDLYDLAEIALENRRVGIDAMPLMMDCASGASAERRERIERERIDASNLLSDAIASPFYPSSCEACGSPDLGDAFRAPFACEVPALFVSGALDARTPPDNVDAIRAGFSNHAHILVENAAHESRELMSEEFRDLLQAFLRGEPVKSCTIVLPPLRLAPLQDS
ncbi:MAG: alpha/beta fold hydrolase [bacterium]